MRSIPLNRAFFPRAERLLPTGAHLRLRMAPRLFVAWLVLTVCQSVVRAQNDNEVPPSVAVATADIPPPQPETGLPQTAQPEPAQAAAVPPSVNASKLSRSSAKSTKATKSGMGRLPRYYAGLVDSQQRQAIYEIRARLGQQINALEQQLEELRAAEMQEIEALLTDAQQEQLAVLRTPAPSASTAPSSN